MGRYGRNPSCIAGGRDLRAVIPAQAGIQFCFSRCAGGMELDSRLRGNDGVVVGAVLP